MGVVMTSFSPLAARNKAIVRAAVDEEKHTNACMNVLAGTSAGLARRLRQHCLALCGTVLATVRASAIAQSRYQRCERSCVSAGPAGTRACGRVLPAASAGRCIVLSCAWAAAEPAKCPDSLPQSKLNAQACAGYLKAELHPGMP